MKNWEKKKLADVCDFKSGTTISPSLEREVGDVLYVKVGDMNLTENEIEINTSSRFVNSNEIKQAQIIPEGAVIFPKRGGAISTNKKRKVVKPTIVDLNTMAIIPTNKLDSEYFYYWFQMIDLNNISNGTTIPQINNYSFDEIFIQYPKSLPEQQRIVSILDEAFAAIAKAKANAEQNLKNARELFESYLQSVFEKKGDGWQEKTLEELADENCTLSYGIVQPGEEFENGLPVIRPTDLITRFVKIQGLKRIDPKLADGYQRTKLVGDELLLCVRGTTGVVSIATPELKNANVTRGIVPIRFNKKIVNQEFGYYLLISSYVQKQIQAKTYGAALMQINIGDLRKIKCPFPSLKEQQTIVRQLDALRAETQKLEVIYQKKIEDLEELKKSILQKAFSGELRTEKVL